MSSPALHPPGSLKNDFITEDARVKPTPRFNNEQKNTACGGRGETRRSLSLRAILARFRDWTIMKGASCVTSNIPLSILNIIYNLLMAAALLLSQNDRRDYKMCLPVLFCPLKKLSGSKHESAVARRTNNLRIRKYLKTENM